MLNGGPWSGTAHTLQLAADGVWEECVSVELPAAALPEAASALIERAREHVGIEVFIGAPAPHGAFVGCRLPVAAARDRLPALCDLARSTLRHADLHDALRALLAQLSQPPHVDFTRAELGVVNAWRSAGARVIWQAPAPLPEISDIAAQLRAWPPYGAAPPRPLALELTVDSGRCWIGIPVPSAGTGATPQLFSTESGSMRAARAAGMSVAASAVSASTADAASIVAAWNGSMPKS